MHTNRYRYLSLEFLWDEGFSAIEFHCLEPKCGRRGWSEIEALITRFGADRKLVDLARQAGPCNGCGRRGCHVQPAEPPRQRAVGGRWYEYAAIRRAAIARELQCLDRGTYFEDQAMCGRYALDVTFEQLRDLYNLTGEPANFGAYYNAAPTQSLPVARLNADAGGRRIDIMRWGLVPIWAKDLTMGAQCINARAETVATKPAFRGAFKARRCLVPATAFYEWQKLPGGKKQPYAFGLADGAPMTFAGLWESWGDKASGERLLSFSIITGEPNELTRPVHDRMPVILDAEHWPRWLGEEAAQPESLLSLLRPYPAERMKSWPVSTDVGNVRNQAPQLLQPIAI